MQIRSIVHADDYFPRHCVEREPQDCGLRPTTQPPDMERYPHTLSRRNTSGGSSAREYSRPSGSTTPVVTLPSFREAFPERFFPITTYGHLPPLVVRTSSKDLDNSRYSDYSSSAWTDDDQSTSDSPYNAERPLPRSTSSRSNTQEGRVHPDGLRIFSYNDEYGNAQHAPAPNPVKRTWEKYAVQEADANGTPYYQCLWKGESGPPCDYQSEKQAMKRHIEVTHLKIKPHMCPYCGKAFGQKTALNVHKATHTGETPLECRFHCGEAFSDPARRHRHYERAHGYRPKGRRKNQKRTPLSSNMDDDTTVLSSHPRL